MTNDRVKARARTVRGGSGGANAEDLHARVSGDVLRSNSSIERLAGQDCIYAGVHALAGVGAVPTAGNTWVERTTGDDVTAHQSAASGLAAPAGGVLLDYVRATLPATPEVWREVHEWVGAGEVRPIGWRGWYDSSATVLDGGLLAWNTVAARAERSGVLVDLPGRACASLGERLPAFLQWVCDAGKVRRADFAIDDRCGRLTYERLSGALAAGGCVSRAQGARWVTGHSTESGGRTGWTLYVGSRSSEATVRFYDKAAERLERGGYEVAGGSWVRCELESKGDFADALSRRVLSHGLGEVVGQINRRVRFCEPSSTDSNRRRWPVAGWWVDFMGTVEQGAALTCGEQAEVTLESLREYVRRQAGPALACLMLADGGDLSWLSGVLADGERRLKPEHRAALAAVGVS